MKLIQLKCKNCGATLDVNKELDKVYCNHCGTEFLMDNGSTTHVYKKVDETKIKENEIKDKMHERELHYKEKEQKREYWGAFVPIIMLILMGIIISIIPFGANKNEVVIPMDSKKYNGENYQQVIREFEDMGFENVTSEPIEDLITGWITKDGAVEKVSINGDTKFEEGDIFPKNASVVVTYHTFKNE